MSLTTILNIGKDSLSNSRAGIETTGHNIANAHTEGYSKQIVKQASRPPRQEGMNIFGTGAKIQSISRAHDRYVEKSLQNEMQINGKLDASKSGLERLEDVFSPEVEGSVIQQYDKFSAAINELALYPEELTIRTNVRDFGQSLGRSFKQSNETVSTIRSDYNSMISDEIKIINGTLSEVADLNMKIKETEQGGDGGLGGANDLRDQRDLKLMELAKRIDINWYEDSKHNNLVVRGPGSTLLVEGKNFGMLKVAPNRKNDNMNDILFTDFSGNTTHNITSSIKNGMIHGLLQVRDKFANQVLDRLDELAFTFVKRFNDVHGLGYGIGSYSGEVGRSFFQQLDDMKNASSRVQLSDTIMMDVNSISTGVSPDSPGDNIVANQLSLVFGESLFAGGTANFHGSYSDEAGKLGVEVNNADMLLENSTSIMNQLKNRKESVSGVSLDEEAAELVKYQHLFTASSKLITTTDEMFETVLNLKR